MTKEMSKINGIDVSECKYYDDGICCNEDVLALTCDKTDCIYKQLKRLQEENEKLKADLKGETEQAQKWYQLETDKHFLALKFCKALEEIRDITEEDCKQCFEIDGFSKPDDCGICPYSKILQKINEVLND